jgi:hypothetical protein
LDPQNKVATDGSTANEVKGCALTSLMLNANVKVLITSKDSIIAETIFLNN